MAWPMTGGSDRDTVAAAVGPVPFAEGLSNAELVLVPEQVAVEGGVVAARAGWTGARASSLCCPLIGSSDHRCHAATFYYLQTLSQVGGWIPSVVRGKSCQLHFNGARESVAPLVSSHSSRG